MSGGRAQIYVDKFDNFKYKEASVQRRSYEVETLIINETSIEEVVIDSHVDKHADHISDELILKLVHKLSNVEHPVDSTKGSFSFFTSEIEHESRLYKMVWLLEKNKLYVGILTAFRDRRLK